jgi:hypothetical protein
MAHDVFISYATPDLNQAEAVCNYLESQPDRITCWMAPRNIAPGAEYGQAIHAAIQNCRVLILILSEQANQSEFVRREVESAINQRKQVVPVRIQPAEPTGGLAFFIHSVQRFDAVSVPFECHLPLLANQLRRILGSCTQTISDVLPPTADQAQNVRRREWEIRISAATLIALVVGFFMGAVVGLPTGAAGWSFLYGGSISKIHEVKDQQSGKAESNP